MTSPQNNQAFTEGSVIEVRYLITDNSAEAFRYAEIRLISFNGETLSRLLVDERSGGLVLRLPLLPERVRENFFLNIRGYFGASYRYAEKEIGIQVNPTLAVGTAELVGIGVEIFAGSEALFRTAQEIPVGGSSRIAVYNAAGDLIASGDLIDGFR